MGDPDLGPWEYLGYQLLVKIKEQHKRQISRSKFLKVNCLADDYLRRELDTDINLPRYWYLYGEIMDENSINGEFYHAPSARGFNGQQYLPSQEFEDDEFDVSDDERAAIQDAAQWAAVRFAKRNAEQIKAHQYKVQAPKEFIRGYSELRERLSATDLQEQQLLSNYTENEATNQEIVLDLLDEMLLTYPEERYDDMYPLYLQWDDTARMLVEGDPQYNKLANFLDSFIKALSKVHLRFVHGHNIPEDRIQKWERERDDILSKFEEELDDMRTALLEDEEPSGELEKVGKAYNESVVGILNDKP